MSSAVSKFTGGLRFVCFKPVLVAPYELKYKLHSGAVAYVNKVHSRHHN